MTDFFGRTVAVIEEEGKCETRDPFIPSGKCPLIRISFSYHSHRRRRETTGATEKEVPADIQVQRRVFECGEEECQDVGLDVGLAFVLSITLSTDRVLSFEFCKL